MKLAFQRKTDRIIGSFICRIFSLFSRRDSSQTARPGKILVILLSEMGSLVLAKPMFERIKQKYPQASVYVLLFEQNKEILEIIDVVHPENILCIRNSSFFRFVKDSFSALAAIRSIGIDTVIDCELFARISSIYAFLSGAEIRAGFHPHTQEGLFRGDFINRPVLYNPYHHISQQFITLAEALISEGMPKVKRSVAEDDVTIANIKISAEQIAERLKRFKADFPHVTGKKLILIYPGGGLLPVRAWPLEYYCRVAQSLLQSGYSVAIIGMSGDKDMARAILSHCQNPDCIDMTGYTKTIRELMEIFHFASLLITNDGGPGHFASMTPISSIIFYGPETPVLYGPLSRNAYNFYLPLSCSPCITAYNHRNSPCDGNNVCLKTILPEDVLAKAYRVLENQGDNSFTTL
jgi:ADP-heptose:LPS heptosyltransferase